MFKIQDVPFYTFKNKEKIEQSQNCGCYKCLEIFPSNSIVEWTDQFKTGLCPKCHTDSLLPDSDFPVSIEILQKVNSHWFKN